MSNWLLLLLQYEGQASPPLIVDTNLQRMLWRFEAVDKGLFLTRLEVLDT